MTDTLKHILSLFVATLLLMLVGFLLGGKIGYDYGKSTCVELPQPDTTTTVSIDSSVIQGTVVRPDADSLIRIDSVPYPVPYPVYLPSDTVHDHDTVYVYLMYEHRLFSIPDTLNIWYSGIQPKIDSVMLYAYHTTEIINQPYKITEIKSPLVTLDIGIGNHQWQHLDPYVFARATVAAGNWKIEPYAGYAYSRQAMFGVSVSRSFVLVK